MAGLWRVVAAGTRAAGRRCAPYKCFAKQNLGARRNSLPPRKLKMNGAPAKPAPWGNNAAMIGCQGYYEYLAGNTAGWELNAKASLDISKG